jgi:glycosyltransferase involved in cell wall biosynthesis
MTSLEKSDVDFAKFENQTEYVSVVITYVNAPHRPEAKRYELLENCVNSIHRLADYPFEIIVVDDSGLDLTSLNVKDRISTLVLNMGKPLKQCVQQNRGISCASSKYIIRMEDDNEISRPCFRDIVNVLDKPYVGFINPEAMYPGEYLMHRGTKFIIGGGLGGAWFNCFRKDVWKEVGGLPEWSHMSNPPFCHRILKHGYWRAFLVGDALARDVDDQGKRSTYLEGSTTHYPKIFAMPEIRWSELSSLRHQTSNKNYNESRNVPASTSNFDYWIAWKDKVTKNLGEHCISSIDWEAAKIHGQDKWRDLILSEEVFHA